MCIRDRVGISTARASSVVGAPTNTGGGICLVRPFASSSPCTAAGENASAANPYTVSVGSTTSFPSASAPCAAASPLSKSSSMEQSNFTGSSYAQALEGLADDEGDGEELGCTAKENQHQKQVARLVRGPGNDRHDRQRRHADQGGREHSQPTGIRAIQQGDQPVADRTKLEVPPVGCRLADASPDGPAALPDEFENDGFADDRADAQG